MKHGNKSILDLSENVKKLLKLKEIKEKESKEMVTVISIDNTNVFKYTEMKLDLLFRPQEELDESQLGELKVILIWEKILKVNFKNTLKEWSDESNASNKHEMLKNFNERASELLKELTKRFFDSKLDFEFNSFIQYEKSLLHVTLKHTPRFAEGIKEITWNEKISVLGDGAKFLCSIIFRLNSIDSSDPR